MASPAAAAVAAGMVVTETAAAATATASPAAAPSSASRPEKLHGRAFYESIGSPKFIVAPMVDQSEFAWRMLTRSFLPEPQRPSILAYSPMLHARLYTEMQKYRDTHFQPTRPSSTSANEAYLDGNPEIDRPLFVQFCANDPAALLSAAQQVAPYCDAVDLNLGCPQGIARKGRYGAFLQEDQDLIYSLIHTLHQNLPIPVTAKIRILDTKEATLAYAQNVLRAGASILTVHGRRREQKGHLTGVADWAMIRYLREKLPPETVLFANGNILQTGDLERCLEATGADGVMSAEGNLSDPAIFAPPPDVGREGREYWRGRDGKGGWRVDAVMRRYLDILYRHVLDSEPPARRPLFLPGDDAAWLKAAEEDEDETVEPQAKRRKRDKGGADDDSNSKSPNLIAVKAHLFHLLRHLVGRHHDVRNMCARIRSGDMANLEKILDLVERKTADGLLEYERTGGKSFEDETEPPTSAAAKENGNATGGSDEPDGGAADADESSAQTVRNCRRPWWVAQPIVRPLPKEALAKGAISMSKKEKKQQLLLLESQAQTPASEPPSVAKVDEGASPAAPVTAAVEKEEGDMPVVPVAAAVETLERSTSFPTSDLVSG